MSEIMRNQTEKEEYYKLITDEKSNHIGTNANGAGSQCVRRKNIGSLSFRERYLSLRQQTQMGTLRVPIFYQFNLKSLQAFPIAYTGIWLVNFLFHNSSYISFHFRRDMGRYGRLLEVQRME